MPTSNTLNGIWLVPLIQKGQSIQLKWVKSILMLILYAVDIAIALSLSEIFGQKEGAISKLRFFCV